MKIADFIFFLFITYINYIIFFITVSIFGAFIISIIKSREKKEWNLTKIEYLFISFAIGISSYLVISYILLIFEVFNFFNWFFPIFFIDILFLIYFFKKQKFNLSLEKIRNSLILNKKNIILSLFIVFVVFFIQFLEFLPILSIN